MRLFLFAVLCCSLVPSAEAKPQARVFKVFVKSGSNAEYVVSNLRSRIGSSSKYSLVSEDTSDLQIFVACIHLRSHGGIETGLACYETVTYMPFASLGVRTNTYLGSTAASGPLDGTAYLGGVMFEGFVDLATEDNLNEFNAAQAIAVATVSKQVVPCPSTQ